MTHGLPGELPPEPRPKPEPAGEYLPPRGIVVRSDLWPLAVYGLCVLLAAVVAAGLAYALLSPLPAPAPRVTVLGPEGTPTPALTYEPQAQAITPITGLTTGPAELVGGGGVTGSLFASADRIDVYARSAATATLYLVEWVPEDSRWVTHGDACSVATDLKHCPRAAKRGARYWHVYKSAGSVAYTGIEQAYGPITTGMGPAASPSAHASTHASGGSDAVTLAASQITSGTLDNARVNWAAPSAIGGGTPAAVTATTFTGSGSGLTSVPAANLSIASQAAGDLLYASSGSAWARLAKGSDGQVLTLASGAPSWAAASGVSPVLNGCYIAGGSLTDLSPSYCLHPANITATAGAAARVYAPSGSTWSLAVSYSGTIGASRSFTVTVQESSVVDSGEVDLAGGTVVLTASDGANPRKVSSSPFSPTGNKYFIVKLLYDDNGGAGALAGGMLVELSRVS